MKRESDSWYDYLHILVLWNFAVAQPLLDLLGRNAEFFLARASPSIDLIILSVLISVVIPIALGLFVLGACMLHERSGVILHWIVITFLGKVRQPRASR